MACSAGGFFRRMNVLLAKVHVETQKGEKMGRVKRSGPGLFPSFTLAPTLRVTVFTLPSLHPS